MPRKKKDTTKKKPEKQEKQEEVTTENFPTIEKPKCQDDKALNKFIKDVEKQFGDGCIASADEILDVTKVPTRNLLLDILTGGGIPQGSITLFFGEESSGKSMQTYLLSSVFTSQKIPVLYICPEGDVDKNWISTLGNDLKYFKIARPDNLEKAIDLADVAVRSRQFGMVIFDSVTASLPKDVFDKSAFDKHMGKQAKLNTDLVQKLTSGLQPENLKEDSSYNKTMVVLIAHVREKIGVVYGNPETIPGGHALRHHSSYIVKFKRGKKLTKDKEIVGREMRVNIDKAKFSRPLVSGVTDIRFDPPRLDNGKVLVTYAIQYGIVEQAGPYLSYGELKEQGKANFLKALKNNPKVLKEIKDKIIEGFTSK